MSITPNINPEENFWDMYADFKVIEPFKSLYKKDKSKSHKDSSVMMWFVVLAYSKMSSLRNLSIDGSDGRYAVIGEDYCSDKNYYTKNKEDLEVLIDGYKKQELTALELQMETWTNLLHKRTKFLNNQEYTFETCDELDKMAANTDKVYKTIKAIQDDINKEDASAIGKGGTVASLND